MELKTYQKQVMDDLSSYLGHLNRDGQTERSVHEYTLAA